MENTHPAPNHERIYLKKNKAVYLLNEPDDAMVHKPPFIVKSFLDRPNEKELTLLTNEYKISKNIPILGIRKALKLGSYMGIPALWLTYHEGVTLHQFLKTHRLPLPEKLKLAKLLTEAIGNIHQLGIVHQDLNIFNILITPERFPVIIDFEQAFRIEEGNLLQFKYQFMIGNLSYISPEQTGRLQLPIDTRSDLYTLGVCLYKLFTGKLPFESDEISTLIHSHVAKIPEPAHKVNPNVPVILSEIIRKLLSKHPDDRYQSAFGIRYDLMKLQEKLYRKSNTMFRLGKADYTPFLKDSKKIYGRAKDTQLLENLIQNCAAGDAKVCILEGPSGIGKTFLIENCIENYQKNNNLIFIKGKFEQIDQNIPFFAIRIALQKLVSQLLLLDEQHVTRWKNSVLKEVLEAGSVLKQLIPNISLLFDDFNAIPELKGAEAQNRLFYTIKTFLRLLKSLQTPILLFFDDIQWADDSSKKLVQELINPFEYPYLMLVLSHRGEHSLNFPKQPNIYHIHLQQLTKEAYYGMIWDTFDGNLTESEALSELLYLKTNGNPFFTKQMLHSLVEQNAIYLNEDIDQRPTWHWNEAKIQEVDVSHNVVELMREAIKRLPPLTQDFIRIGACIGTTFEIEILAHLSDRKSKEVIQHLNLAILKGILNQSKLENSSYQFKHDRIQQAAYMLLDEKIKSKLHLQIGKFFVRNSNNASLFETVQHWNLGQRHLKTKDLDQFILLNQQATQKAKDEGAFEVAYGYIQHAISKFNLANWHQNPKLSISLHLLLAELAALNREFEVMDEAIKILLDKVTDTLELLPVYEIIIFAHSTRHQYLDAVRQGLHYLKKIGLPIPIKPSKISLLRQLIYAKLLLKRKKVYTLHDLPSMKVPRYLAIMKIIAAISIPGYMATPELIGYVPFIQLSITLKKGLEPSSSFIFAVYGFIQITFLGEFKSGIAMGQEALRLSKEFHQKTFKAKTALTCYTFIKHWEGHLEQTFKGLNDTYRSGCETGDIESAGLALSVNSTHQLYGGYSLSLVEHNLKKLLGQANSIHTTSNHSYIVLDMLFVSCLHHQNENSEDIISLFSKQNKLQDEFHGANDKNGLFVLFMHQFVLCVFFNQLEKAKKFHQMALPYLDAAIGTYQHTYFCFMELLVYAQESELYKDQHPNFTNKNLNKKLKKLKRWAQWNPVTYEHKLLLCQALLYVKNKKLTKARTFFDRSIDLAKRNNYIQESALAAELAAQFYFKIGNSRIGSYYINTAYQAYSIWKADAKIKQLQEHYSNFISQLRLITDEEAFNYTNAKTLSHQLDLDTVIKASSALSKEVKWQPLLSRMMEILTENFGAANGFLFKYNNNWEVLTSWNLNEKLTNNHEFKRLPLRIVNFVRQSKETIILEHAIEHPDFASDPYIKFHRSKSVLCHPILLKNEVKHVLFLENNLGTGMFTNERIELLKMLSSQIAISIDNAYLYENLEEQVNLRTQKVQQQKQKLEIQNSKLEELNNEKNSLIHIVAHDLKSPLNRIEGLSNLVLMEHDEISATQQSYIHQIQQITGNLRGMISRILDVKSIESSQLQVRMERINVAHILKRLVEALINVADKKNIQLYNWMETDPLFAIVDEQYTYQILENLLSNAIKFSPPNKRIDVKLYKKEDKLIFEVKDQGPGLTEEDKKKLFGKFQKLSARPTGDEHSTGLGLSIVKKFADIMEAKVWCESSLGSGATFLVAFKGVHSS